jgi:hypothetical protein
MPGPLGRFEAYRSSPETGLVASPSGSFVAFTQQDPPDRAATPTRNLFTPVRKHTKRSHSPPAPSPLATVQEGMSTRQTRNSNSAASAPLGQTTVHNVLPTVSVHTSSPLQDSNGGYMTAAPRIRAKLTPNASPRKKPLLPGTEFADMPTPRAAQSVLRGGSTAQLVTSSSPIKVRPAPLKLGEGFGLTGDTVSRRVFQTPVASREAREVSMEGLSTGLAGLGLSSVPMAMPKSPLMLSSKGRDNVLVCVRSALHPLPHLRQNAHKLAQSTTTGGKVGDGSCTIRGRHRVGDGCLHWHRQKRLERVPFWFAFL